MSHNPYSTPASAVSDTANAPIRVYTPAQVACGVFLGGPVGLVYFLYANFTALGNERLAKATILYGVIFVLAAIFLIFVLPEKFPSMPINLAYMFIARHIAEKHQLSKQIIEENPQYELFSNWRVLGFSIPCFIATFVIIILGSQALAPLGLAT